MGGGERTAVSRVGHDSTSSFSSDRNPISAPVLKTSFKLEAGRKDAKHLEIEA